MKLVIPMAGFGTRMRPHTWSRPKPLLPLAGKPMLDHILDSFEALPIDAYVFVIGYLGNQVRSHMAQHHTLPAHFVEQDEMLGQAHAIWLAREHLEGPLLLTFVDTLLDEMDLSGLDDESLDGAIFTKWVDDPRRFGVVETDEEGWALRLIEKPDSKENKDVLAGLYYFREGEWLARACEELMGRDIQTKGEYYPADAVTLMINQGARFQTRAVGVWQDTGKPEPTLETHRYLLDHGCDTGFPEAPAGVTVIPPVYIHPDATIERSVVGPYVSIGKHAKVRGSVLRDAVIDEAAEIDNAVLDRSIIGRWAKVDGQAHQLNLGDSSDVTV